MRKRAICILLAASAITVMAGCGNKLKVEKEDIVTDKNTTANETVDDTPTATPYVKSEDTFTQEDFKNSEYVTIDDVNVREKPDADSDVIYSMPKGSKVSVTGREEDSEGNKWYTVSIINTDDDGNTDEITGYMSTKYVNIVHKKGEIK